MPNARFKSWLLVGFRQCRGMNCADVAAEAHIALSRYQKFEVGEAVPSVHELMAIGDVMNIRAGLFCFSGRYVTRMCNMLGADDVKIAQSTGMSVEDLRAMDSSSPPEQILAIDSARSVWASPQPS